jgi:Mn2+/Fe2+ NRAMP family transporter
VPDWLNTILVILAVPAGIAVTVALVIGLALLLRAIDRRRRRDR